MSWIERVQSNFTIKTGDGRVFHPLWIPLEKAVEYNISEFNFRNISGSLVRRTTPKGRRYSLEFYFQGDDHIEQSNDFENSARDSRPWVISHPYYDSITVQPVSLTFDNSQYNVTKITGTAIETITQSNPRVTADPVDDIRDGKAASDELFIATFDEKPSISSVNTTIEGNKSLYRRISGIFTSEEYFRAFNTANTAMLNATAEPLAAMRAMQTFANAPALFNVSVQSRMIALSAEMSTFRSSYLGFVDRSYKKMFELLGGAVVSGSALAASTPIEGDYTNRDAVLRVAEDIVNQYNQYIEDLDSIQSENGGDTGSYIPDPDSLLSLSSLIDYTVSNLFSIAMGARQERTIYLEDDSNIIVIAHRLLGLQPDDSTIEELMEINNIGLNELLSIRKGRQIIYYV